MGRSMCVHVFGTYFGLSTSFALRLENTDGVLNRPNYCSNMTAIIGKNIMYSPFECNIIPIKEELRQNVESYATKKTISQTYYGAKVVNEDQSSIILHVIPNMLQFLSFRFIDSMGLLANV